MVRYLYLSFKPGGTHISLKKTILVLPLTSEVSLDDLLGDKSLAGDLDLIGEALLKLLRCLSACGLVGLKDTCLGVYEASRSSSLVRLPDLLSGGSANTPLLLLELMDGRPLVVSERK